MASWSANFSHPKLYHDRLWKQSFEDCEPYNVSLYKFEEGPLTETEHNEWLSNTWMIPTAASLIYIIAVFQGKKYMSNRPPLKWRIPLILWNVSLAVFSICGSCRMVPEVVHMVMKCGYMRSVCNPQYAYTIGPFWGRVMAYSKIVELGDTFFVVTRKQPLIFLHWYHHVSVLMYTWLANGDVCGIARWFMAVNFVIHSVMYSYYTLRALKIKVPRTIAMMITFAQMMQMAVNLVGISVVIYEQQRGNFCALSSRNLAFSVLMYTSYIILFANYFYNAYFATRTPAKKIQ